MKIYISGKMSGLTDEEVRRHFEGAESILQSVGFEVVNPYHEIRRRVDISNMPSEEVWKKAMLVDIEMLFECDAIFMLDNWLDDSVGAAIEYDIAVRMKKHILFESTIHQNDYLVMRIKNAIHEATGLQFEEYMSKSRKTELLFARMLFCHMCKRQKMSVSRIARLMKRDHTIVLHTLKKYKDEVASNMDFARMSDMLDKKI